MSWLYGAGASPPDFYVFWPVSFAPLAASLANIGQGDGQPGLEADVEAHGAEAVVDYIEEPGAS